MRLIAGAIILLILSLSSDSVAKRKKDPCKEVESHTDAFGKTTRGKIIYIGLGRYLAVGLIEENKQLTFRTLFVRVGTFKQITKAGASGKLAFVDGAIIEIETVKDASPVMNANSATIFTQWGLDFSVSDDLLAKLASTHLKAVKSIVGGEEASFEVPEVDARKLQKVAICLSKKDDAEKTE